MFSFASARFPICAKLFHRIHPIRRIFSVSRLINYVKDNSFELKPIFLVLCKTRSSLVTLKSEMKEAKKKSVSSFLLGKQMSFCVLKRKRMRDV